MKSPPLIAITAYYLMLTIALTGLKSKAPRRRALRLALLCLAVVIPVWAQYREPSRAVVLPVGAGLSVFVRDDDDNTWLIDPGDERNYRFRTRELLKTRGVNRLDHLVLTHADINHVGAAALVITEFQPRHIWINPLNQRSASLRALQVFARSNQVKLAPIFDGAAMGPWRIVHPNREDRYAKADSGTLVMLFTNRSERILFCNDLDSEGQKALVERHPGLRAERVIISPNSDRRPVHSSWLQLFQPRQVVVADSRHPAPNRFPEDGRAALKRAFTEVIFLSDTGAFEIPLATQKQ